MNRKANGEGTVFQVNENKWLAKIFLGTKPNGTPIVKQFTAKTESAVKKKLRDFKKSPDYVQRHLPSASTVQAYFTHWLKEYQLNKLKPASYDRLESTVRNHIIPNIGTMKIDKVTQDTIQALINDLYKRKGLSYSSVKKVYVALNSCYKHAQITDVVIKNPCLGIVLPSPAETTKEITPLKADEVIQFKAELDRKQPNGTAVYTYGKAFLLILNTGLRMGEALSLRWSDIDFNNKTIAVAKNSVLAKKRDKDGDILGGYELLVQNSTKTASGRRTLPMNKSAEEALLALQNGNKSDFVIVNNRQNQVLPSNFERSFKAVLRNAGIETDYGVHALRHTFASMLFAKGIDVKIVSKLLGHSTVKITYDIYVHLFEESIKSVTSVLD